MAKTLTPPPLPTDRLIVTNDLRKGHRVRLRNGWFATVMDNARGNIRMCDVEGFEREIGSVYSHDIVLVFDGDRTVPVQHTPKQLNLRRQVGAL